MHRVILLAAATDQFEWYQPKLASKAATVQDSQGDGDSTAAFQCYYVKMVPVAHSITGRAPTLFMNLKYRYSSLFVPHGLFLPRQT